MNQTAGRRDFLKYAAAVTVGTGLWARAARPQGQSQGARPLKACQSNMLMSKDQRDKQKGVLNKEQFALAKKCGFEGIELSGPIADLAAAKEMGALAREAGVPIHGVVNGWGGPLSDPKPENVAKGIASMETSLRCAKAVGATTVLLVPAVVNEEVGYGEAWERSQKNVRTLLPLAKEMEVVIAVENVWNKFLLSPLEFAKYVDEFNDPWLKAYIDVGNMIQFGYAQDWIRTVGKRIAKIHLKDFRRKTNSFTATLLEGDVNWPQVRKALAEIGYHSYLTTELGAGDEAYLTDLAQRIDKILAMK